MDLQELPFEIVDDERDWTTWHPRWTKGADRIIIHRDGNPRGAATRKTTADYFWSTQAASSHFVVDEDGVLAMVPMTHHAYHVSESHEISGTGFRVSDPNVQNGRPRGDIGAIGIEICERRNPDGSVFFPTDTYFNAVRLVIWLAGHSWLGPRLRHIGGHSDWDPNHRPDDPDGIMKAGEIAMAALRNAVTRPAPASVAAATVEEVRDLRLGRSIRAIVTEVLNGAP